MPESEESDMPTIVEALEEWRLAEGWNYAQMAHELGMNRPNYSAVIHGKRKLPARSMKRAYTMGIPAEILMQEERENANS